MNTINSYIFWFSDGSLLYERVPNKPELERLPLTPPQTQSTMQTQQTILKRTRPFDDVNGSDGKSPKTVIVNPSKDLHEFPY